MLALAAIVLDRHRPPAYQVPHRFVRFVRHPHRGQLTRSMQASPAADIERNLRAMLNQTFQRLDLVTREEFDVQAEMLVRLRERVVQLEQRVAELERVPPPPNPLP